MTKRNSYNESPECDISYYVNKGFNFCLVSYHAGGDSLSDDYSTCFFSLQRGDAEYVAGGIYKSLFDDSSQWIQDTTGYTYLKYNAQKKCLYNGMNFDGSGKDTQITILIFDIIFFKL